MERFAHKSQKVSPKKKKLALRRAASQKVKSHSNRTHLFLHVEESLRLVKSDMGDEWNEDRLDLTSLIHSPDWAQFLDGLFLRKFTIDQGYGCAGVNVLHR